MTYYQILGPVQAERKGASVDLGGPKSRLMFALLLVDANEFVTVDRLIDRMWGDSPPKSAAHAVQVYVSRLRGALGDGAIEFAAGSYRLVVEQDATDLARFDNTCSEAKEAASSGDLSSAFEGFRRALALWRGPAFGDLGYVDALAGETHRLEERRLQTLGDRAEVGLALGRHGELVSELTALSHAHPLDERFRGQLARALYALGRQGEALRAIADYRTLVREELGLDPTPELERLESQILDHDLSLADHPSQRVGIDPRPSIAVLPFTNATGDEANRYLADGIAHELIASLTPISELMVIARPSSFSYREPLPEPQKIGRELGARYLLTGSLRQAGDRLRITADLTDATNAVQLWADRFDGSIENVFALQDDIVARVVGAIQPALRLAEISRVDSRRDAADLRAHDLYLRALPSVYRMTLADHAAALQMLATAVERDPHHGPALATAAWIHALRPGQGWDGDEDENATKGVELARRAVEASPNDGEVLAIAGYVEGFLGQNLMAGLRLLDRALELNPNSAIGWAFRGWLRLYTGDPERAEADLQRSLLLSPRDPLLFRTHGGLAFAYLFQGNVDEAIRWASLSVHENRNFGPSLRALAAALAHAGFDTEAAEAARRLFAMSPEPLSEYRRWTRFRYAEDQLELLIKGLRRAGLPETSADIPGWSAEE